MKKATTEVTGHIVYVTKYALSNGVMACEEDGDRSYRSADLKTKYRWVRLEAAPNGVAMFSIKEAHDTIEAAQARVREMVAARRKAIAKELAKLDAIERDGAKVREAK